MTRWIVALLFSASAAVGEAQTAPPAGTKAVHRTPQESIVAGAQAIEVAAEDAKGYYNRGIAYARSGRRVEAIAEYGKAIELDPTFAQAYYERANSSAAAGEYARAIDDCTKAIELNPKFAEAYCVRGVANAYLAKKEESDDDFRQAVALKPALEGTVKALSARLAAIPAKTRSDALANDIRQAVRDLNYPSKTADDVARMVSGWNLDRLRQRLATARDDLQLGKIDKARVAQVEEHITRELSQTIASKITFDLPAFSLSDVVTRRKTNCLGYAQLVYVLGNSIGLTTKAAQIGELARRAPAPASWGHIACLVELTDGTTVMVEVSIANKFVSKPFILPETFVEGHYYSTLKDKSNPLGIHPSIRILNRNGLIAAVYTSQGNTYTEAGQHDRALTYHRRAIELDPTQADPYTNRANSYLALRQYSEAMADFDKAVEIHPGELAFFNRGTALHLTEQHGKAISDLTRAIELRPKYREAYLNRGSAHLALGKYEEAVSDYTSGIEIEPGEADAYYNRSIAYARWGRDDDALADLNKTIALNPRHASAYLGRGYTLAKRGKTEEGKRELRKALQLDPSSKPYVQATCEEFKLAL
jgi:tetratricopeptide (TPR) repeat protein